VAEHCDQDADGGYRNHERKGDKPVAAAEQLRARLGGDHTVDCEPTDGKEEGQRRADVGTAQTEDAACVNDLREPSLGSCVAEEAKDDGGSYSPQCDRKKSVPDAKPVIGGEKGRREQAGVVDEGARPQEAELAGPAAPPGRWDRPNAIGFDLAKGIDFGAGRCGVADVSSLRWHYPVQVHAVGACRALSARTAELPLESNPTPLGDVPRGGEEVGEDAIHLGVECKADVAALDLDCVHVRAEAGPPVDDPIRA
jgi:hypothetical protein